MLTADGCDGCVNWPARVVVQARTSVPYLLDTAAPVVSLRTRLRNRPRIAICTTTAQSLSKLALGNLFPAAGGVRRVEGSDSRSAGPKINLANHDFSIPSASEGNDIP